MANSCRRRPRYLRWENPSKCPLALSAHLQSSQSSSSRHPRHRPPLTMSFSQSSFSSFDNHASSSSPPRRRSSESFAAPNSPRSSSPVADSPADDRPWDEAWWARFPGHIMASGSSERSWWWLHGYRLLQAEESISSKSRYVWVCKICVAKRRPPPVAHYRFIASTGRSPINHLRDHHRIRDQRIAREHKGGRQPSITHYLNADISSPQHQEMLSKLASLYVPSCGDIMLLDWIVAANLPFRVVSSPEFRRWATYRNPGASLPTYRTLTNLLMREYQRAVPYVQKVLQSARGLIHFTFDGWTSRQNVSFMGMNAHFLDQDWVYRTVFLGLPALPYRHTGIAMADEMATILQFFGVEDDR
jgi:hypothetical protein